MEDVWVHLNHKAIGPGLCFDGKLLTTGFILLIIITLWRISVLPRFSPARLYIPTDSSKYPRLSHVSYMCFLCSFLWDTDCNVPFNSSYIYLNIPPFFLVKQNVCWFLNLFPKSVKFSLIFHSSSALFCLFCFNLHHLLPCEMWTAFFMFLVLWGEKLFTWDLCLYSLL